MFVFEFRSTGCARASACLLTCSGAGKMYLALREKYKLTWVLWAVFQRPDHILVQPCVSESAGLGLDYWLILIIGWLAPCDSWLGPFSAAKNLVGECQFMTVNRDEKDLTVNHRHISKKNFHSDWVCHPLHLRLLKSFLLLSKKTEINSTKLCE